MMIAEQEMWWKMDEGSLTMVAGHYCGQIQDVDDGEDADDDDDDASISVESMSSCFEAFSPYEDSSVELWACHRWRRKAFGRCGTLKTLGSFGMSHEGIGTME